MTPFWAHKKNPLAFVFMCIQIANSEFPSRFVRIGLRYNLISGRLFIFNGMELFVSRFIPIKWKIYYKILYHLQFPNEISTSQRTRSRTTKRTEYLSEWRSKSHYWNEFYGKSVFDVGDRCKKKTAPTINVYYDVWLWLGHAQPIIKKNHANANLECWVVFYWFDHKRPLCKYNEQTHPILCVFFPLFFALSIHFPFNSTKHRAQSTGAPM